MFHRRGFYRFRRLLRFLVAFFLRPQALFFANLPFFFPEVWTHRIPTPLIRFFTTFAIFGSSY